MERSRSNLSGVVLTFSLKRCRSLIAYARCRRFSTVALAGDELLLSLITHARHGLSWTDLAGIG
jgi:hypothetical protein